MTELRMINKNEEENYDYLLAENTVGMVDHGNDITLYKHSKLNLAGTSFNQAKTRLHDRVLLDEQRFNKGLISVKRLLNLGYLDCTDVPNTIDKVLDQQLQIIAIPKEYAEQLIEQDIQTAVVSLNLDSPMADNIYLPFLSGTGYSLDLTEESLEPDEDNYTHLYRDFSGSDFDLHFAD